MADAVECGPCVMRDVHRGKAAWFDEPIVNYRGFMVGRDLAFDNLSVFGDGGRIREIQETILVLGLG